MKIEGVRLILHPGMPKCGSSSIQASLILNLQILRQNNVFILDKKFRIRDSVAKSEPHGIPYSIIFECLDGEKNLELEIRECCRLIKENYHIDSFDLILSSEVLSFIKTVHGHSFHEILSNLFEDSLVIMIIRSPWTQLLSNWRQGGYRHGDSFKKYSEKYLKPSSSPGEYWESRIEEFNKLYGKVNILSLDTSDDIVGDFYRVFIEKKIDLKSFSKKNNRSLSPVFCELMSKYPDVFQDEVNDIRNTIKRHKNILDDLVPSDSIIFSNDALPEHIDQLDKLRLMFMDKYFILLGEYGGHTPKELNDFKNKALNKRQIMVNDVNVNNISELMLVEIISNLKRI